MNWVNFTLGVTTMNWVNVTLGVIAMNWVNVTLGVIAMNSVRAKKRKPRKNHEKRSAIEPKRRETRFPQ